MQELNISTKSILLTNTRITLALLATFVFFCINIYNPCNCEVLNEDTIINSYKSHFFGKRDQKQNKVLNRNKRLPDHAFLQQDNYRHHFFRASGECPKSFDGSQRYFCPTPLITSHSETGEIQRKWICIDEWNLCDSMKNCPGGEDENRIQCLFYVAARNQIQTVLAHGMEHAEREYRNDAANAREKKNYQTFTESNNNYYDDV